jgi:8-oxo-dGTP pyrophosphatase MutT (NUDIX family)
MDEKPVVRRHIARAILLDVLDRVLLFWLDPTRDPRGMGYWYLPGGGIDEGETPEVAIARELQEEAGIVDAEIGPRLVHLTGVRFEFDGRIVEQDEWHVLVRTDAGVRQGRANDNEADAVRAHRWWRAHELAASSAIVYPAHLRDVLDAVITHGPPAVPLEIQDRSAT